MLDKSGWVFVGGKSSRFGCDKAFAKWQGRPLTAHVADVVRAAAGSVTLVGDPQKYGILGLTVIPDAVREAGPVGGLLAVLNETSARWNLVTACDMPYLKESFLRFLLTRASGSDADVVLPVDGDGLPQPLCAVYRTTAREVVRAAVANGERKLTKTFEGLQVVSVSASDYSSFNKEGNLLVNVNYPEDLRSY